MGYLFENMEKMDILEERRKTEKAESRAEEAESRAEEAESRAEEARKMLEETQKKTEEMIGNLLLYGRKNCVSEKAMVQMLMDVCGMDQETAKERVKPCWKDEP